MKTALTALAVLALLLNAGVVRAESDDNKPAADSTQKSGAHGTEQTVQTVEGPKTEQPPRTADQPSTPTPEIPPKTPPAPKVETSPVLRVMLSRWSVEFYGFAELDMIHDSTQGLIDSAGNAAIARPDTFAARHQQWQFGVRNSRLGFHIVAPEFHGVLASGIVEMDFLGNEPAIQQAGNGITGGVSEAAFFNNPSFRIRHMAMKLETPIVDIIAGQYWELFGWQSYFQPNTVEIQGVPGEVYSRTPQLRISHTFKSAWLNLDVAVAVLRPPQRGSDVPDGQAGLKLSFNKWKGVRTAGATGTATDSAAIGISGILRKFSVPSLTPSGSPMASATGSGFSIDTLIPIIPASADDRANGLTLTGSFVLGTGIADQYTGLTGGYTLPPCAPLGVNCTSTTAPMGRVYSAGIDSGLVDFDTSGNLHTINWQSFIVGLQYYLPPTGKVWLAANYSDIRSSNGASMQNSPQSTLYSIQWFNADVFWDMTPAARVGLEYDRFVDTWNDTAGSPPVATSNHNDRIQLSFFYIF